MWTEINGEMKSEDSVVDRKFRVQRRLSKKGFTLVELIVVLVILGILAAIMVPSLLGRIDKAKENFRRMTPLF